MRIEEKNGRFVIVDFQEIEAYKIALKIEEDGIEFYKNLLLYLGSQKSLKENIDFLLGEELRHRKFFEKAIFDLRKIQEDLSEDNDLLNTLDYGIFKSYQGISDWNTVLKDPDQAIKFGLDIENNSLRFYDSCKMQIKDESSRKHLGLIIEEELRHKQILEDILSNL
jgi:rubrerythrin